jgi:hypothetical protein
MSAIFSGKRILCCAMADLKGAAAAAATTTTAAAAAAKGADHEVSELEVSCESAARGVTSFTSCATQAGDA